MKMNFTMHNEKNIDLSINRLLKSLNSDQLTNLEHGLRHPLGIFNVSKMRFLNSLNTFLDEYENGKNIKKLNEMHLEIMESFNAFIDDSYHILKCFFHSHELNLNRKFAYEQLKNVIPEILNNYYGNIKPLGEIYSLINNSVKHNHARYNSISIKSIYGKNLGYFIESIDQDGVIVPNMKIHPKFKGKHTGISYNYDIKRVFIYWLKICDYLEAEIRKVLVMKSIAINEEVPYDESDLDMYSSLFKLIKKISKLKEYYFIDEYDKGVSKFEFKEKQIEIVFPAPLEYKRNLFFPQNYEVQVHFSGDGVSKSWVIPYFESNNR